MVQFLTEEMLYQKSPQELTALLYEACLNCLEQAIQAIKQKQYVQANWNLVKANDILHRLGAGLNYEAGIIADQLEALYEYMADRLIEANIKKDVAMIEEVLQRLSEIAEAWNYALQNRENLQSQQQKLTARAYDLNSLYDK